MFVGGVGGRLERGAQGGLLWCRSSGVGDFKVVSGACRHWFSNANAAGFCRTIAWWREPRNAVVLLTSSAPVSREPGV